MKSKNHKFFAITNPAAINTNPTIKKIGFLSLSLLTFILLINLVSAYNGLDYGRFSISEFLSNIDPSLVNLGMVFIISFAILFFSLSRVLRTKEGPNNAVGGVIAFAIASLITYEVNRTNFSLWDFFYNIGIPNEILSTLIPLIVIAVIILMIITIKSATLLVLGAFLIAISFTNLIYQRGIIFILGAILAGIGLWLISKKKKKGKEYEIRIKK